VKHVPNVVVTSSDVLPKMSTGAQPAMSVTIPPEHMRSNQNQPKQLPGAHPFQINLLPNAAPPQVRFAR